MDYGNIKYDFVEYLRDWKQSSRRSGDTTDQQDVVNQLIDNYLVYPSKARKIVMANLDLARSLSSEELDTLDNLMVELAHKIITSIVSEISESDISDDDDDDDETDEQKQTAIAVWIEEEVEVICNGCYSHYSDEDIEKIEAAIARSEELQTPWFAGQMVFVALGDTLKGDAVSSLSCYLFPEKGEAVMPGIA